MPQKRALKSELASAALAIGIFATSPSFADEQGQNAPVIDNDLETVHSVSETSTIQNIDPYNPIVPDGVLWGLAALVALGGAYRIAKKKDGALSRTLAMAAGAAVLMNPEIVDEERLAEPTEFLILIDKSESQNLDGRDILTSEAYAYLSAQLENLDRPVNIRTVEFGEDNNEQNNNGTALASALFSNAEVIPASRLGGIFILSDGRLHDSDALGSLQEFSAPVHALISGKENEKDFSIEIEDIPRFGLMNEAAGEVTLRVNAQGVERDDLSFLVRMSNNGQLMSSFTMYPNQNMDKKLPVLEAGENNIEFSIAEIRNAQNLPVTDIAEVSRDNNRITASVEGIEENSKVLLLSGSPHQGTRLWREVLGNDAGIDFVHFANLRPSAKEDATPLRDLATIAFPVHEVLNENMEEYDVIIFDARVYGGEVPFYYLQKINDFVQDGGGLIVVGSDELTATNSLAATPLGEILPFTPLDGTFENEFVPELTARGLHHPLGRLIENAHGSADNWGPWYSMANTQARSDAEMIMSDGAGHPLLTLSKTGEGRVAVLASEHSWLWARGHGGGGPAVELNRNLVRWAAGYEALDEENVMLRHEGGELVVDLQTMGDQEEDLIITAPSGKSITVSPEEIAPGLRRAFVPAAETGVYKVERDAPHADQAFAEVGFTDAEEMINVVSTVEVLEPLVTRNGGVSVRMAGSDGSLSIPDVQIIKDGQSAAPDQMAIKANDNTQVIGTERTPLIPDWLALCLSLGLFAYGLKREGGKTWKQSLLGNKGNKSDSEPPAPGMT